MTARRSAPQAIVRATAFALILAGAIVGTAGTDLVLPAIPGLPAALGGTPAQAQLVLAAFSAGFGVGLLGFGELGARLAQDRVLLAALALLAATSGLARASSSLDVLIGLRFAQGMASAAASVFAPGMVRALYPENQAVRAIGLLGSIESMVPAFAPIVGAWLVGWAGWTAPFTTIAAAAVLLGVVVALFGRRLVGSSGATPRTGSYARLLRKPRFLRLAAGHACALGGLLVFVFGAPTVFVDSLGGSLGDFVAMQLIGITAFVVTANLAAPLVARLGVDRAVLGGSLLVVSGLGAAFAYAVSGGGDPFVVALLFVVVEIGLGLRGPAGFFQAMLAADGDDSRGAALIMLITMLTAALGTAAAAPFITGGLTWLTGFATAIAVLSILLWRRAA